MKSVLVIIPAYNEQDNIKRVVDNLIENYPQYDYVVVNDNKSLDELAEEINLIYVKKFMQNKGV